MKRVMTAVAVLIFMTSEAQAMDATLVEQPLFTDKFQPTNSEIDSQELADQFFVDSGGFCISPRKGAFQKCASRIVARVFL